MMMSRRAEIDTRPPFKSVKEAVILFGETVLAAELNSSSSFSFSNKLKHQKQDVTIKHGHESMPIGAKTTELQETKQSLNIAREESLLMANCLISLKQELEETKRELQQIKASRDFEKQSINPDIEYLKFVENVMEAGTEIPAATNSDEEEEAMEFQNKPCVKFANPPAFVHVMNTEEGYEVLAAESRHPSLMKQKKNNNKKKKLTLIPLIGRIFSKKKGVQ